MLVIRKVQVLPLSAAPSNSATHDLRGVILAANHAKQLMSHLVRQLQRPAALGANQFFTHVFSPTGKAWLSPTDSIFVDIAPILAYAF